MPSSPNSCPASEVLTLLVIALSLGMLSTGSILAQDKPLIACTGGYALCSSAPCIPIPELDDNHKFTATQALCSCAVVYGANIAQTPCDTRDPGDGNLISTYSFAQTTTMDLLTCPDEFQFTDCLNAPCRVDPNDPTRADCTCPIRENNEEWVTFGGGCYLEACAATLWSGATQEAIAAADCCLTSYMSSHAAGESLNCKDEPTSGCTVPNASCSITR